MLNKLLKRCMPWQQKGKWVRIYIDWTDTNNPPVVKGPDWLNVTVEDVGHGEYNLSYNPDDYYCVTETKQTLTSIIIPEDSGYPKLLNLYGELYEMRRGKGYIDMFMSNIDVTTVSNGSGS